MGYFDMLRGWLILIVIGVGVLAGVLQAQACYPTVHTCPIISPIPHPKGCMHYLSEVTLEGRLGGLTLPRAHSNAGLPHARLYLVLKHPISTCSIGKDIIFAYALVNVSAIGLGMYHRFLYQSIIAEWGRDEIRVEGEMYNVPSARAAGPVAFQSIRKFCWRKKGRINPTKKMTFHCGRLTYILDQLRATSQRDHKQ